MDIIRKINMLSTKEWMQYLQYKLSSDREKELNELADRDEFLKEAVDAFNKLENRNLAYHSLSLINSQVEEMTGVSESKITTFENISTNKTVVNKWILISVAALILLSGIIYGVYYMVQNGVFESNKSEEKIEEILPISPTIDSLSQDSSSRPLDVIPVAAPAIDTTTATTTAPTTTESNYYKKKKHYKPKRDAQIESSGEPTTSPASESNRNNTETSPTP